MKKFRPVFAILYGAAMVADGASYLVTLGMFPTNLSMRYLVWDRRRWLHAEIARKENNDD